MRANTNFDRAPRFLNHLCKHIQGGERSGVRTGFPRVEEAGGAEGRIVEQRS